MFRHHRHHLPSHQSHPISGIQPLSSLIAGQTGIVMELKGGNEFLTRMISLGFCPGCEVLILRNHTHGPVLTIVRDSRLALGQGEAQNILVRICDDAHNRPNQV